MTSNIINSYFFEGTEKLVEIIFEEHSKSPGDLRLIPRKHIEKMLRLIRCEVVSFICNEDIHAFILSESSLFIFKQKIIIKTCGATTLLRAIDTIIWLAKHYGKMAKVADFYYSRKNFLQPERQLVPHQSFEQETYFLNTIFNDYITYNFTFCPDQKNDRQSWFLYTLSGTDAKELFDRDQTLEILMNDVSPSVMDIFTRDNSNSALEAREKAGIHLIIPEMVIDDYLFDPCGYSMNGILKNGYYMTIHITPESDFSYVSFETNFPAVSYRNLVEFVTDLFEPNQITVTVFAGRKSKAYKSLHEFNQRGTKSLIDRCERKIEHVRLKNYDLLYASYSKFPS